MFFTVSKVVGLAAIPSNLIASVLAVALVLGLCGRHRVATRLAGAGILTALMVGFSPLSTIALLALTDRFPRAELTQAPDGIIVLGGAIDSEASQARGQLETVGSAERIFATFDLARRFPHTPIIFSGGSGNLFMNSASEAPFMEKLLREQGIDPARIRLEGRSRTTAENARYTADLLKPVSGQRWLLLTSAWHMPRAVGVFRSAGFDVLPWPVDYRTRGWNDAWLPSEQMSSGLARADLVAHEVAGLVAYRLRGLSAELFPAPWRTVLR